MTGCRLILLIIFLSFTILQCRGDSGVRALTAATFDSTVDNTPSFVEFYAPWCGHCKHLAPEYEIVGQTFSRFQSSVVIAKVDCDAEGGLCSKHGIQGFPTLKFFNKGDVQNYEGERTAEGIISFINEITGLRAKIPKAPSKVVDLNGDTFDKLVLQSNKHVFVEFFAPWCGHCKQLAPDWEKLAIVFENEPNIIVAKVDSTKHELLASKYKVEGYPTLYFFGADQKENKPLLYSGERDLPTMIEFLNEHCGTSRTFDGRLNELAGRIEKFDQLAKQFVSSKDQKSLLKEATQFSNNLDSTSPEFLWSQAYLKAMQKLMTLDQQEAIKYLSNESERLTRMITSPSVLPAKRDEFSIRLNVLNAFK